MKSNIKVLKVHTRNVSKKNYHYVTLPVEFARQLGIGDGDYLNAVVRGGCLVIEKTFKNEGGGDAE